MRGVANRELDIYQRCSRPSALIDFRFWRRDRRLWNSITADSVHRRRLFTREISVITNTSSRCRPWAYACSKAVSDLKNGRGVTSSGRVFISSGRVFISSWRVFIKNGRVYQHWACRLKVGVSLSAMGLSLSAVGVS